MNYALACPDCSGDMMDDDGGLYCLVCHGFYETWEVPAVFGKVRS